MNDSIERKRRKIKLLKQLHTIVDVSKRESYNPS